MAFLTKIRHFTLLFVFIVVNFLAIGQKQGSYWYFGGYAGMRFVSGNPIALTNSGMYQYEGCATISDSNGNLLFYTNGMTIWNKTHAMMVNGIGLKGGYPSTQSSIIVPKPDNPNIYYVFTIDDAAGPDGLQYSIVDMSKMSGLGEVVSKNNPLLSPTTEKVTAVRHRNKKDVWVITHQWNSAKFYAYKITSTGVITTPVISDIGVVHGGSTTRTSGYLKASPDGSKLALAINHMSGTVEIFNFNDSTGVLSSPITMNNYQDPYGIEFSPDGTKLYVSSRSLGQIHQYDLSAGSPTAIINSKVIIGYSSSQVGALQVAINGKLYVARTSYYLGVINAPNKLGPTCNYVDNGFYLAGKQSQFGLPTFNQSYFYNPEFKAYNLCFGDTTKFEILNTSYIDSVKWHFGDSASGIKNTSKIFDPWHIYTSTGNFLVQLIVYHSLARDTVNWSITIKPKPEAAFVIPDTNQCRLRNLFLMNNTSNIQSGTMQYLWNLGDGNSSTLENVSHSYSYADTFTIRLFATSNFGCKDTFMQKVVVKPSPKADFEMNDSAQCFDRNKYEFINKTTITKGTLGYFWTFGDGGSSTLKDPLHTYYSADTFPVRLVATSNLGCKDTMVKIAYVVINPSPVADFEINDTSQCIALNNFIFTNTTVIANGTVSYRWLFGDGDSSTAKNPTHQYSTDDIFTVRLTAISDIGCKDWITKKVKVNPMPVVSFTLNNTGQCLNSNNVVFTNTSTINTGTMTWFWNFGDGLNSTQKNPTHKFVLADSFRVKLIATSEEGCQDSASKMVYIYPMPIVNFFVNSEQQCLRGNLFTFNNNSSIPSGTINSYLWKSGDGSTYTTYNASHSYATAKDYNVKLIAVSDKGCKDSVTRKMTVNPNPRADFNVNNRKQCLFGNYFSFSDTSSVASGNIVSYYWNLGDNTIFDIKKFYHSYQKADTFFVKLIVTSDKGCKDSITYPNVIYPDPEASFTVNDNTQCLKDNKFILTNTSKIKSGSILSWQYFMGDGNTINNQNVTHSYANYGDYQVRMVITSALGCRDTAEALMKVFAMPVSSFTINNPTQCLEGNHYLFTNTSYIPTGTIKFYDWDFGDGIKSAIASPSHDYTTAGMRNVVLLITSDYGCTDSTKLPVNVHPMPVADFSFSTPCLDGVTNFTDKSAIASPDAIQNWFWQFGDTSNSTLRNPVHSYSSPGIYTISLEVTSDHGCRNKTYKAALVREHVTPVTIKRATVTDAGDVLIEWTPATKGAVMNYIVERSGDGINFSIAAIVGFAINSYLDKNPGTGSNSFYYKVQAVDSCGYKASCSNFGKTILLKMNIDADIPHLDWTRYLQWPQGIAYQDIWLKNESGVFEFLSRVQKDVYAFDDNITAALLDDYCYKITAYSLEDTTIVSQSNTDCRSMPLIVWVPNAFSPNHDGVNDTFHITGKYITGVNIQIVNRWGELVWENDNLYNGWDGNSNGQPCPMGVYAYRIIVSGTKDQKKVINGTITLIR